MRQVGHMPASMPNQLGPTQDANATSGTAPSRWQTVKNTLSEGLHKLAHFFSGLKNAAASLFERRPTVPPGSQFKPITKDEAQQRIDQTVQIVRQKLAAKPNANPPEQATVFSGTTDDSVNTFMRQTGADTEGKAVSDLVKPMMAETATRFWNQAQLLLIQHGENGKPANVQLDPAKDPTVDLPGERDRRVAILSAINHELLQGLLGGNGSPHDLPLPVQAAVAQLVDLTLSHCSWDTSLPASQKTADQLATEKKLREVVVAHVMLTGLNGHASDLMAKMDASQAEMKSSMMLITKLLQTQFNMAVPGKKEAFLSPMVQTLKTGQASIVPFCEAVYKHGASWGGIGDYGAMQVGTVSR